MWIGLANDRGNLDQALRTLRRGDMLTELPFILYINPMKRRLTLLLILVFAAGAVHAQGSLTSGDVERFLNSLEKLNQLPDTDDESMAEMETDPEALKEKMTSPFSSSLAEMRENEMFREGLAIMQSEGFSDEVEWASVGDRVMRAYAALKMGDVEPEMDENMAKALAELEKSDLPEEMKQKMREAMDMSQGLVQTMQDVPPGDVEAVEPHMERFEKMAEMPEEQ